jgi:DNA-binding XRE family transcriptional regulator
MHQAKGDLYMEIRLGESIRKLRKGAGFTQEQLAEALGVSVSAVQNASAAHTQSSAAVAVAIPEKKKANKSDGGLQTKSAVFCVSKLIFYNFSKWVQNIWNGCIFVLHKITDKLVLTVI